MTPIGVLSVVSEIFPLIKTGGLADIAGALPGALATEGIAVRSLVPGYPQVLAALDTGVVVARLDALFGGEAQILAARAAGLELFVVDAPHLFGRGGDPYRGTDGHDWPDNALRFAGLARVAALLGQGLVPGHRPDIVHAHDWQAGLAPAYLHYSGGARPATVMTVHNLAFQGHFPAGLLAQLDLPAHAYSIDGVEYYGGIGYLKAGLRFADCITTVSPTYALEICTPSGGVGMDGLLRTRADVLLGILNGIDETVWDPGHDPCLTAQFDIGRLAARSANKAALQAQFGLEVDASRMLFGAITRLAPQKGTDMLLEALPTLIDAGGQLALLGSGDHALEAQLRTAAAAHPASIGVRLGYNEEVAHRIQGGCDALLVPSRFEPCGLTQLCAMRYGAVPVVAHVGGLCDTVIDANEMALTAGVATGFHFAPVETGMLIAAIKRAISAWQEPALWQRLQRNAMQTDVTWRRPAKRYAALYRHLVTRQPNSRSRAVRSDASLPTGPAMPA
jgi:starch synthase